MNLVEMTASISGVDDGYIHPKVFLKGEQYHIGPDLAKTFGQMGVIKILEAPADDDEDEAPAVKNTTPDLTKLTKSQLRQKAASLGVTLKNGMSEDDLIAAIEAKATAPAENKALQGAPENK